MWCNIATQRVRRFCLSRKFLCVCIVIFLPIALCAQGSGDSLFMAKCSTCHGKDGAGKTAFAQKARIPELSSSEVQSMSNRELFDSIARGTKHKAYPHAFALRGMSDGEVDSLVRKIREFGKKTP
jgi:mono/diheme cytochrome c family protein